MKNLNFKLVLKMERNEIVLACVFIQNLINLNLNLNVISTTFSAMVLFVYPVDMLASSSYFQLRIYEKRSDLSKLCKTIHLCRQRNFCFDVEIAKIRCVYSMD